MKKICFALIAAIMMSLMAMPAYAWISLEGAGMFFGDYKNADGTVEYIKDEKLLILNNVNYESDLSFCYASEGEIEEIRISGINRIRSSANSTFQIYGTDTRITGSGSLIIGECSSPIIHSNYGESYVLTIDGNIEIYAPSNDEMGGAFNTYELVLKNGAKLHTVNKSTTTAGIWADNGITLSGGSELYMDTMCRRITDAINGPLTVCDTSRAELITNTDFRSDYEIYDADAVTIESVFNMSRPDYFEVTGIVPAAGKNRITITQTEEPDGRFRAVIQGANYAPIPETGDSANLALYAALMLLGAGLLILKKREA